MTKNIRTALSPLLIINYIFGLKITEFPAGRPRLWFSLLYILFLWTLYLFLVLYTTTILTDHSIYYIFRCLTYLITLLSIMFGIYYDKKFRNSLRKLTVMDITLEKLGTTINYQQLHKRIVRLVLGYFAIAILINYIQILFYKYFFKYNTATAIYLTFMLNYCSHINLIGDLTMTSILEYIGKKFDQVNEHIQDMASNDNRKIKLAWGNSMLHPSQCRFLTILSKEWMIWTIMHLHLELCKISREIDWIFGIQMTIKMGCYFAFMAVNLSNILDLIFFKKYIISLNNILFTIICLFWLFHNIFKLFIINYVCEKVCAKANATKSFVSRISYSTCNVEMCENISQFLLQLTLSPLRFYGLGLFQFGFKFLQGFITSVTTVVVILIQSKIDNEPC